MREGLIWLYKSGRFTIKLNALHLVDSLFSVRAVKLLIKLTHRMGKTKNVANFRPKIGHFDVGPDPND